MKRAISTLAALALLLGVVTNVSAETIVFDQPTTTGLGFNGQLNPSFLSPSGEYRIEAFWLNTSGHFHPDGLDQEANHNNSGGQLSSLQGIRIERVDQQPFDFLSMTLYGQAAIGEITNFLTGAGTYTLFTDISGSTSNPATVAFGSQFTNLTEIYLIDPGAAGGNSSTNRWNNLVVSQSSAEAVPEPSSIALFGMAGAALAGYAFRKRDLAAAWQVSV